MLENKTRVCSKCGQEKPLSQYHKDKYTKSGYTLSCKKCRNNKNTLIRHTPRGVISQIYNHQRECSVRRGHPQPQYTKEELIDWVMSQPNWESLYKRWVENNYLKKLRPSLDRLDNSLGYSFDNIELVDWQENHRRQSQELKSGIGGRNRVVLQYSLDGEFLNEYINVEKASKETNTNKTSLCTVARSVGGSKEKHTRYQANGYIWIYKDSFSTDKINKVVEKLQTNKVLQFTLNGEFVSEFSSCKEVSESLGYSYSSISNNTKGDSRYSHGHIWIKKKDFSEDLLRERVKIVKEELKENK